MKASVSPLSLHPLPDGRTWRLEQAADFRFEEDGLLFFRRVPAGFVTDFASVPRAFWRILPPWGKYGPAAILHDYLYHIGDLSRTEADRWFLRFMKVCGVSWWKRKVMLAAVRGFGGFAWNRRRAGR